MNYVKIISTLCGILLMSGYSGRLVAETETVLQNTQNQQLIKRLELAEINQDIESIRELFADDAIIYVPDSMPFAGKQVIASLYEYLWNNSDNKTVNYLIERTEISAGNYIEYGTNTSVNGAAVETTSNFKAVYKETDSSYVMTQLIFSDARVVTPKLPEPTGKYSVGLATYFYARETTTNHRLMAFQIWYPAITDNVERAKYQSIETTIASAKFLGLPEFIFSYASIVASNSFLNASVVPDESFPIVIYNHGYSGFTSIYQTVFEELASQGYVVVSIGHENESSLLIQGDGSIVLTSPDNEFYLRRAPELEGPEIGPFQSTILNSDDLAEITFAYEQLIQLSPLRNESTRLWASDTSQVIEKLKELDTKDPKVKGAFNFEAIGLMGHSLGGATAGQLAFHNNDIKAGINLDGFQFGDLVNNKLEIPFMFVSSNQNGDSYLRAANFMNESEADCYQAVLSGFTHGSFTDLTFFQAHGPRLIKLQRALILSFFDKYLKKFDVDFEALDAVYPEMLISQHSK